MWLGSGSDHFLFSNHTVQLFSLAVFFMLLTVLLIPYLSGNLLCFSITSMLLESVISMFQLTYVILIPNVNQCRSKNFQLLFYLVVVVVVVVFYSDE